VIQFTATEKRILDILADGQPHFRAVLGECLPDDLGRDGTPGKRYLNLNMHLYNIRKKLPHGEAIICELRERRICYRRVRLIANPEGAIRT
jgi:hypothetical protein